MVAGEEEVIYDAYNIVTSPGEDASTQMNVSYHTHNDLTSLEYTLASDINYENKKVVTGDTVAFEAKNDPSTYTYVEEEFELRNIVSVYLTDLTPGTEYRYRINKGNNTYSEDYTFKTADGGKETTFLFVTDAHTHKFSSQEETEKYFYYDREVVPRALQKAPNLAFILHAGDMVDRGGKQSEWDNFFEGSTHLKHLPIAGTPGNHEYYHYSTGEINAKFYNAHFNNPKNGPDYHLNSTYYFIYNDILFIQLDTVGKMYLTKQMEWFEEVVSTHPTKYIIVTAHKPFQDYAEDFFYLFEQFSVDLVLTGHTHSHNYRSNYTFSKREYAEDPNLGVTYLTGYGSGVKSVTDGYGYLITVKNDKIQIKRFRESAETLWELNSKRPDNPEKISNQEFIDSIKFNLDKENEKATLTWTNKAFSNVHKVEIKDNLRTKGTYDTKEYIWTPSKTKIDFANIHDGYQYDFTTTIYFTDGTTHSIAYVFDLDPEANLEVAYDEANPKNATLNFSLKEDLHNLTSYKVFLNDQELDQIYYFSKNYNKPYEFTDLKASTEYTVRFETYNHLNELIYSEVVTFRTAAAPASEKGCSFGTLVPYTVFVGMAALAGCFFVLRRKQS